MDKIIQAALRKPDLQLSYLDMLKSANKQNMQLKDRQEIEAREGSIRDIHLVNVRKLKTALSASRNQSKETSPKKKLLHEDATQTLRVRIESFSTDAGRRTLRRSGSSDSLQLHAFDSWQAVSAKLLYKPGDKRIDLIRPEEREDPQSAGAGKIIRLESLFKKTESIGWSAEKLRDYYLYCEKGITEGVFIKIDVSKVAIISLL